MTLLKTSARTTLHCLTGCVIGEVSGLIIAAMLGLSPWPTMILATFLAYVSGFSLAVFPLMARKDLSFKQAMSVIWVGEAISIGAMELAMNGMDYWIGGVQAGSLISPLFWIGMLAALPAGFLAAWPVNHILLKSALKKCHH